MLLTHITNLGSAWSIKHADHRFRLHVRVKTLMVADFRRHARRVSTQAAAKACRIRVATTMALEVDQ